MTGDRDVLTRVARSPAVAAAEIDRRASPPRRPPPPGRGCPPPTAICAVPDRRSARAQRSASETRRRPRPSGPGPGVEPPTRRPARSRNATHRPSREADGADVRRRARAQVQVRSTARSDPVDLAEPLRQPARREHDSGAGCLRCGYRPTRPDRQRHRSDGSENHDQRKETLPHRCLRAKAAFAALRNRSTVSATVGMRMRGLEPPRGCPHTDLNRARLPIPPHPRAAEV